MIDRPSAQNNLGWFYEHAQGEQKDFENARELYKKAANQGYGSAVTAERQQCQQNCQQTALKKSARVMREFA